MDIQVTNIYVHKNNTPDKRKSFRKHVPKDRAGLYGHVSGRDAEDGATVEKIKLSNGFAGLNTRKELYA